MVFLCAADLIFLLMGCISKNIFKNSPYTMYLMTLQIWSVMSWLKIQKLDYPENGT